MSCFAVSRLLRHKEASPIQESINGKNGHVSNRGSPKSRQMPNVEIVQEVMLPQREASVTPIAPSSPQFHQHQQQYYYQRHMSPHRSCSSSVPPSPALSGCRSPSRQRKNPYSTLEVQNAALSAMKEEMLELAARLTRVTKERDYLEKALNRLQLEKLRMAKEKDDQLDCTTVRYEERLVELHSVIAELSRQVEDRARDQINEEDTEDEDEEDTVNHGVAVASRTSTEVNAQALEAGQRLVEQLEVSGSGQDLCAFLRMSRSTASQSMHNSSTTSIQYLALQEELADAKERNVQLAARLQQREADLNEARQDLENLAREKENLREKVSSLEEKLIMAPAKSPVKKSASNDPNLDVSHLKVAERKKIKKIEEEQDTDEEGNFQSHGQVTGSDLQAIGVRNSVVVEHLVQDLQDKSSMQEFQASFSAEQHQLLRSPRRDLGINNKRRSALLESKLQEFEIEMERLSSRIEHLKSQNEVLSLTLTESKNHCDNLTVLIGKYESNHTAQHLVITYLDHMIETLEVLVNFLEAELGLNQASGGSNLDHAKESFQMAEANAKKLIKFFDSILRPDSGLALQSSSLESGAHWGDDSSGYSQNSSLGSNSGIVSSCMGSFVYSPTDIMEHQKPEETRLRDILTQLKSTRASIQSTIFQELESHYPEADLRMVNSESKTADLEIAVLVQELMAMREEKADLRAQVYLLEKEKKSLELVISSQQAQEHALKTHIQHLQDELENQDSMGDADSERSLINRNDEMKSRITELLKTLEKVKRNSELRQQQSEELICDLKKTNESLVEALDKVKQKYESRVKHLEQQVLQSLIQGPNDQDSHKPLISFSNDMFSNKSDSD